MPGVLSQSLTDIDKPPKFATFGNYTSRCNWECVVVNESNDFVSEMKTGIGMYRILSLDLTLRKSADDKCVNQTVSYNASKLADAWMWSTVNSLTHEGNVFYKLGSNGSSVTSFSKSVQGQIQGKVACTFNLSTDPTTQQLYSSINDLIANVLMKEVEESHEVWQTEAVLCYKEREQSSLYLCLTFNENSTQHHSAPYHAMPYKATTKQMIGTPHTTLPSTTKERTVRPFLGFIFFIWVAFMLFSPAVLCLFSPTHVYSNQNTSLIVLEGPGHVSIRGWIANKFAPDEQMHMPSNVGRYRFNDFKFMIKFVLSLVCCLLILLAMSYWYLITFQYLQISVIGSFTDVYIVASVWGLLWGIRGLSRVFLT